MLFFFNCNTLHIITQCNTYNTRIANIDRPTRASNIKPISFNVEYICDVYTLP